MFVCVGVGLEVNDKVWMVEIFQCLVMFGMFFFQNILKDEVDYQLVLEIEEDWVGLLDFLFVVVLEVVCECGLDGKYVIIFFCFLIELFL